MINVAGKRWDARENIKPNVIVIAGDSWGCGDWDQNGVLSRPGSIEHFLIQDGYNVCNLSLGGGSNAQTLERLELGLDLVKRNNQQVSKVFVWQTDWLRNLQRGPVNVLQLTQDLNIVIKCLAGDHIFEKEFKDNFPKNVRAFVEQSIHYFYCSLSDIGLRYDVDIGIIGGCSDTLIPDESFSIKYPRLSIACHSSTNIILDIDSTDSTYGIYNLPYYNNFIHRWLKIAFKNDLKNVIEEMDRSTKRLGLFDTHQSTYFLDKCHPSRAGYQKIYTYLKDTNQLPLCTTK
jgi:hypothetical protein